ncbi:SdrD B-like domain-containing protein [Mariniblastus fucicola]|uniref:Serine-aspartate repeat-containing protein D n=1 Tax=Mariniblastus fucicola TaxID=980251 RepID=A0A5B9P7R1_9BACT|nr:SdrD B-like domain-containing protein [Mariniblastus fucicola]QEG22687.1 Serine-aspartate repeat-containing protein D precursor [Mariniblastus fucicola]
MSLLNKLSSQFFGTSKPSGTSPAKEDGQRRCRFEVLEERRVLSADPVIAGVTYFEGDEGQDSTPDYFEVSFEGGADTTQLTQFTINGDQDSDGQLSDGDMFFDVGEGQPGTGGYHAFEFDAANSSGVSASDIKGFSVSSDGLLLTVEVDNFEAGDIFAFTIDVDEVERLRVDKIASGVEFEGSFFNATFADQHYNFEDRSVAIDATLEDGYVQPQQEGVFYDEYDALYSEGQSVAQAAINLPADNSDGQSDRTAGAIDAYDLVAKPISISGTVYHDEDLDCVHDSDEDGIANVSIELQQLNPTTGVYEVVATTTTDANGDYEFGKELGLMPGDYRLVETQPNGYLDVGAESGSEGGDVVNDRDGAPNVIGNINVELGNTAATDYDFKEVRPAQLEGNVYHDANDNGVQDAGEEGIANVLIQVTRVGAKGDLAVDPFADTTPIFVRTDAAGHYSVDGLPPGIYEVIEINSYPGEVDPLAAYIDGKDALGEVGNAKTGTQKNDQFSNVELCADDHGVEYNFGELKPASISGYVSVDVPGQSKLGPNDPDFKPIEGVTIQLLDDSGNVIETTKTDATGQYEFDGLAPGSYSVVEIQPEGYYDGGDVVGTVANKTAGVLANDRFSNIVLGSGQSGTRYDFCELEPASISGFVSVDVPGQSKLDPSDPNFRPIEGVTIQLLDESGNLVKTTKTDASGQYQFNDLEPGTYSVVEVQPEGYLDGGDVVGGVANKTVGTLLNDRFDNIVVGSGQAGTRYDFCEHEPASIKGTVYHDRNDNGRQDSGEEGIANVLIELMDADGNVLQSTKTDANGDYCFEDLLAGEYMIAETQPGDYLDGKEALGSLGGQSKPDAFNVTVVGGDAGVNYDFGELLPGAITGYVHTDDNEDCVFDESQGELPLANVTLELLDADGKVIATTTTDDRGFYQFTGLEPGTYSVRETQPDDFFSVGEKAGSGNGDATSNLLSNIEVGSGQRLTDYNFCEQAPAEIHGRVWEDGPAFESEDGTLPDDYRDLRDGVYTAGVDTPIEGVRMELYYYFDPNGQFQPRPVKLSEVMSDYYTHMDSSDPDAGVYVETMADGEYWFQGLKPGSYVVLEAQPEGYADANDIPGPTQNGSSGVSFNTQTEVQGAVSALTQTFSAAQLQDTVANIVVDAGGISTQNNFTEVRSIVVTPPVDPPNNPNPGNPTTPATPNNPVRPNPGITGFPGLAGAQSGNFISIVGAAGGQQFEPQAEDGAYSWHLSVINAGQPRAAGTEAADSDSVWQQAGFISDSDWNRFDMDDASWTFTTTTNDEILAKEDGSIHFGVIGGIPLAGDFDGNGIDEVAIYKDGYWMIDINRNGKWDRNDLLAKLGDSEDRPVAGDWDGDGKDDIGIYGPMWARDPEAIEHEPGLPNPDNSPYTRPKNVPPQITDATNGSRVMKLTSFGREQSDVVDHVFGLDDDDKIPVTGDWNGNGVRSIGTFRDGVWDMDVNGDGRFDHLDKSVRYGQTGDVPVVGDFNGDGIEEIAIYRNGTWIIDSNGNGELDITDRTFELGGVNDKPVVGDWDGDGVDEPAIYHEQEWTEFN